MSEHGFTVTSDNVFGLPYSSIKGKPYITVSAKGLANGTSNVPNDGADFGPDTLQADGSPTQTSGIAEANEYANTLSVNQSVTTVKVVSPLTLSQGFSIPPYVDMDFSGNTVSINGTFTDFIYFNSNDTGLTLARLRNVKFILTSGSTVSGSLIRTATSFSSRAILENIIVIGNSASNSDINIAIEFSGSNNLGENLYVLYASIGFQFDNGLTGGFLENWYYGSTAQGIGTGINIDNVSDTILIGRGRIVQALYGIQVNATTSTIYDLYFSGFNLDAINVGIQVNTTSPYVVNDLIVDGWAGAFNGIESRFIQGDTINFLTVTGSGFSGMSNGLINATVNNSFTYVGNTILSLGSGGVQHIFSIGGNGYKTIVGNFINMGTYPYLINGQNSGQWRFSNNAIEYTGTTALSIENMPVGSVISDNLNLTPVITTPSVPASGTALQNTNPYKVSFFVNGGTVTEIQITRGGTAYTVLSNSTGISLSSFPVTLEAGDSITLTYTTAPTWTDWMPE